MKVTAGNLESLQAAYQAQEATPPRRGEAGRPRDTREAENDDHIEVSTQARDLERLSQLARESPDIRQERVAQLREDVANGSYRPDPKAIAQAMMMEGLQG